MAKVFDISADTLNRALFYRDFIIEESIEGWEWTHKNYPHTTATGLRETPFECLDAIEDWHMQRETRT